MAERLIECATHGSAPQAYVCGHSLLSLRDGSPRGLLWTVDEDGHFNGYCNECDDHLEANGGEWNETTEAFADLKVVCEVCFRRLAALNDQDLE